MSAGHRASTFCVQETSRLLTAHRPGHNRSQNVALALSSLPYGESRTGTEVWPTDPATGNTPTVSSVMTRILSMVRSRQRPSESSGWDRSDHGWPHGARPSEPRCWPTTHSLLSHDLQMPEPQRMTLTPSWMRSTFWLLRCPRHPARTE